MKQRAKRSAFLVALPFMVALPACAAPVAMLTGVRGEVLVVSGGKNMPARNGTALEAGDTVRVGAGGLATVYYLQRAPQTLRANQQVQIAAPGAQANAPSVWGNVYKGIAAGFARRGEKIGATVRPGFATDQVLPLSPVNSLVLQRPVLTWALENLSANGDYQITLRDTINREIWTGTARTNSIEIPDNVALENNARYFWVVTPRERDAAGNMAPLEEKRSSAAWFAVAESPVADAARTERLQIAFDLQDEPEAVRRIAQGAALAERQFFADAIAALTRRTLESETAKGSVRAALQKHDALVNALDEEARWQLRRLYLDTKQSELANRIARDENAEATPAGAATGTQAPGTPATGTPAPGTPATGTPANNQNPVYTDTARTFSLRVPADWKSTRQEFGPESWMTQFSNGDPTAPQITVITMDAKGPIIEDFIERFGKAWMDVVFNSLRQTGEVGEQAPQKIKFLERDALRVEATYNSPQTGSQKGSLTVVLGRQIAFMIGVSAPVDKPQELEKLNAIAQTLVMEPGNAPLDKLGVDLSPINNLPAPVREAMAGSEALIRIGDEILNPPPAGVDANGKPLSGQALRAAFETQNAAFKNLPLRSLERWRAGRDLAVIAGRLGWEAYDAKDAAKAASWFSLRGDFEKASYDAARGYYTEQFVTTQKQVEALEAKVPVNGPLDDDRLLLETLHHLQGMRAGTLDNLSRGAKDHKELLRWAQAQISVHSKAHEYKLADVKNNGSALKFAQQDIVSLAGAVESLAEAYSNLGRFDEAEKNYLQSLELRRSLPTDFVQRYTYIALRLLANFYASQGDTRRAQEYYRQAWQDVEASMPLWRARWEAEESPAYRELMMVETTQTRAILLNHLSLTSSAQGDYRTAEKYLRQALDELDALPKTPRANAVAMYQRATLIGNLGVLRNDTGDLAGAQRDLEESVRLWREQGSAEDAGMALLNLSAMMQEQGRLGEARQRLAQARQFLASARDMQGIIAANWLEALAAREAGRYDEAATYASEALTLARQQNNSVLIAPGLRALGAARLKQGRLDEARNLLDEAARHDARTGEPIGTARTLFWQGELLEARQQPQDALEKYRKAIDLIEGARATARGEINFGEHKHIYQVYENTVRLLIKMGRATEAFDYLGRSKSKQLQDSLRLTNLKSGNVTIQAHIDRAAGLQSKIRAFESALQDEKAKAETERNPEKMAALQERIGAARGELQTVAAQLKTERPGLDVNAKQPSLEDVQKQMPADTALLQWAPIGDQLYAFVVTQNAIKVQALPTRASEIWARVRDFRRLMDEARRRAAQGQNIAVQNWLSDDASVAPLRENLVALRQALIAPVEAQIAPAKTVVFIPNGLLYYLPLHALARRDGDALKFFGQEKQVAYLAAADVLSVLQKGPARGSGLLALGDPAGAGLPAAQEEAKALAQIFPAAQLLTGAQATKSAMLTPQNEARRIWHLATHGVLNASQPDRSYILLAPGAKPGDEELTIGEVYGLDLRSTDLVTLSACQTAIGERNPDGLEITSLATAFSRAGADSVVASLWSVADDSTRDFMVEFYKRLAAGNSKTQGLQGAQAKLLSNPRTNHPYYWAPFVLMGDWR